MSASCGICAVSSVLKYYGEEESYYDLELSYLKDYISVTLESLRINGSNVKSHNAALEKLGYNSEYGQTLSGSTPKYATYEEYMQFMRSNLREGRPIVVSTYLGSGHFITVIGLDDMGTDYIYDDALIIADSSDYWDGYQDGYNIYPALSFLASIPPVIIARCKIIS